MISKGNDVSKWLYLLEKVIWEDLSVPKINETVYPKLRCPK